MRRHIYRDEINLEVGGALHPRVHSHSICIPSFSVDPSLVHNVFPYVSFSILGVLLLRYHTYMSISPSGDYAEEVCLPWWLDSFMQLLCKFTGAGGRISVRLKSQVPTPVNRVFLSLCKRARLRPRNFLGAWQFLATFFKFLTTYWKINFSYP